MASKNVVIALWGVMILVWILDAKFRINEPEIKRTNANHPSIAQNSSTQKDNSSVVPDATPVSLSRQAGAEQSRELIRKARLAVYPLTPGPSLTDSHQTNAILPHIKHQLLGVLGNIDQITLLDRELTSHPLAVETRLDTLESISPMVSAADYVLTGLVEAVARPAINLELVHIASARLIKAYHFRSDTSGTLTLRSFESSIKAAIQKDRKYRLEQARKSRTRNNPYRIFAELDVSIGSFMPAVPDVKTNEIGRELESLVTDALLDEALFSVQARNNAGAIFLESRLLPPEVNNHKSDLLVYGELSFTVDKHQRQKLRLHIERPAGLRKTIFLESDTIEDLSEQVISSLIAAIPPIPKTVAPNLSAESNALTDKAIELLAGKGILEEYKLLDIFYTSWLETKNPYKLDASLAQLKNAIELDPSNYRAQSMLAKLHLGYDEYRESLKLTEQLIWDARDQAHRLGAALLESYFGRGSVTFSRKKLTGFDTNNSDEQLLDDLVEAGYLDIRISRDDTQSYATGRNRALLEDSRVYRNSDTATDSRWIAAMELVRFKVKAQQGYSALKREMNDKWSRYFGRTSSVESALLYSRAMSSADIKLNAELAYKRAKVTGKSHSYPAEQIYLELSTYIDKPDVYGKRHKYIHPEYLFRYINNIGMAMLVDENMLESRVLYALTVCQYSHHLCPLARLILHDMLQTKATLLRQIPNARDLESTHAWLYRAMFELAERKLAEAKFSTDVTDKADPGNEYNPESLSISELDLGQQQRQSIDMETCKNCPAFATSADQGSTNGEWAVVSNHYDDAKIRLPNKFLRDNKPLRHWLFASGYLDVRGFPIRANLDFRKFRESFLKQFPDYSHGYASSIHSALKYSTSVKDGGNIILHSMATDKKQVITAPGAFEDQQFGYKVFLDTDHLLVCDKHDTAHSYQLRSGVWQFKQDFQHHCWNSALAGNWFATYNRDWTIDLRDIDSVVPGTGQRLKPLEDFKSVVTDELRYIGLWAGGDLLMLAANANRHKSNVEDHKILVYQLRQGHWTPASVIHSPYRALQIQVFGNLIVQNSHHRSIVYSMSGKAEPTYLQDVELAKNKITKGESFGGLIPYKTPDSSNMIWTNRFNLMQWDLGQ